MEKSGYFESVYESMLQRQLILDQVPPKVRPFFKLLLQWRSLGTLMILTGERRNTILKRLYRMEKKGHVERKFVTGNNRLGTRGKQIIWRVSFPQTVRSA